VQFLGAAFHLLCQVAMPPVDAVKDAHGQDDVAL
jgi:hypothetical protein